MKTTQYLVYPGYGPVKILEVQEKTIGGHTVNLLVLECVTNKMKICVPEKDLQKMTRPLVSKSEASEIKQYLDDSSIKPKISTETWNRRYRTANDKIRDGELKKVAEVFKELSYLSTNKELSFGERKMKETAKFLIDTEIQLVLE